VTHAPLKILYIFEIWMPPFIYIALAKKTLPPQLHGQCDQHKLQLLCGLQSQWNPLQVFKFTFHQKIILVFSGHYTAYAKHWQTGQWHSYNDSRWNPIGNLSSSWEFWFDIKYLSR
jgi:hypothetical protein